MFPTAQSLCVRAKIDEKITDIGRKMLEIYAVLWYTIYNMVSLNF